MERIACKDMEGSFSCRGSCSCRVDGFFFQLKSKVEVEQWRGVLTHLVVISGLKRVENHSIMSAKVNRGEGSLAAARKKVRW